MASEDGIAEEAPEAETEEEVKHGKPHGSERVKTKWQLPKAGQLGQGMNTVKSIPNVPHPGGSKGGAPTGSVRGRGR